LIGFDPATGKDTVIASDFELNDLFLTQGYRSFVGYPGRMLSPFRVYDAFNNLYPWDWAVCHAGTWIRWEHRYVWVTGEKRHHHPPVRWVKKEHLIGFVPVHPRDVAGKPPINLKEGIFHLTGKSGVKVEHASLDAGGPVKLLDEAPKEFRKPEVEPLKSVDTPHAVAHYAFNNMLATKNVNAAKGAALAGGAPAKGYAAASPGVVRTATARDEGAPINFDRKSQSFTVARQVNENGRPTTVSEPLGGRGGGYQPAGNSNSSMARGTNPGGGYSNGGAATSSARSYTPPSSNSGSSNGGSYSRPSAPTYSPPASSYSPPAPSYSAPSAPSGGSSAGSSGGAQHK
jgi:hypothetical protein